MQMLSWRYAGEYHSLQTQALALDMFSDAAVQAALQVGGSQLSKDHSSTRRLAR